MKKKIAGSRKGNSKAGAKRPSKVFKFIFQYHYLFLIIGLIFGMSLVFVNPPWHSNDEDRHFYNAFALSEGYLTPEVENGKTGHPVPVSIVETVRSFQGIAFSSTNRISKRKLDQLKDQPLNAKKTSFNANPSATFFPFPYIPAALMIKAGRVIKSSPVWLGWWGRIGSLLAYLTIVTLALKIIPHFKSLLMIVALSPMALYQGASVSYDTLNLALLFLLFALVIKFYYQQTPITLKQVIIFALIALAHRCSKDGYFILYFSFFALSIRRFESRKEYFSAFVLLLAASVLPSFLWNSYLAGLNLPAGKFQTDFTFDMALNVRYHIQDPFHAIFLLFQNLFSQGKLWLSGSIGRFGYSYTLLPEWIIFIQLILYFAVTLFEKPEKALSFKFRSMILILALLNFFALIAAGLFLLSPVGANQIFGFQGRYFTPLLPFLFLGFFYFPLFADREKLLRWIVPVYCFMVLFYTRTFFESKFFTL